MNLESHVRNTVVPYRNLQPTAPLVNPYQRTHAYEAAVSSDASDYALAIAFSGSLPSVLARNRTWSSTFAESRANPAHSKDE